MGLWTKKISKPCCIRWGCSHPLTSTNLNTTCKHHKGVFYHQHMPVCYWTRSPLNQRDSPKEEQKFPWQRFPNTYIFCPYTRNLIMKSGSANPVPLGYPSKLLPWALLLLVMGLHHFGPVGPGCGFKWVFHLIWSTTFSQFPCHSPFCAIGNLLVALTIKQVPYRGYILFPKRKEGCIQLCNWGSSVCSSSSWLSG